MAIELTPEQSALLKQTDNPMAVRDPKSNRRYVLLTEEAYSRIFQSLDDDDEQQALRRASMHGGIQRLLDEER